MPTRTNGSPKRQTKASSLAPLPSSSNWKSETLAFAKTVEAVR